MTPEAFQRANSVPADHLLTDEQVLRFITYGYHVVDNVFDAAFNAAIDEQCGALGGNPGDAILDRVPMLHDVFAHPAVRGALVSVCGVDMKMNGHRHCHTRQPQRFAHNWHTDSQDRGATDMKWVLAMYYPHTVTPDMGPTVILPGSHFRAAPNPTLESFANIRGQFAMAVPAGTVVVVHPNIWHGAGPNYTDRRRHMLKFLFDRVSPNETPNWRHDPATADDTARRLLSERPTPCDEVDHKKQIAKRYEVWNMLLGRAPAAV